MYEVLCSHLAETRVASVTIILVLPNFSNVYNVIGGTWLWLLSLKNLDVTFNVNMMILN